MVEYVVNASIGENGSIHGGAPGDQTGREVRVQQWYSRPWDLMLRWTDPTQASQAASIAAALANSNLVGYNQDSRNSLYRALKANNFDVNAYIASGTLTNCDCSSFVYACYACVLPDIRYDGNAPSTDEMYDVYTSWGFLPFRAAMYLDSPDYLHDGDILVYEGHHTVIAYNGGPAPGPTGDLIIKKKEVCATKGADSFDRKLAGKYTAVTDLYLRNGPSILNSVLTVIPEGHAVYNYGYYTDTLGKRWLYVQMRKSDTLYTGFASGKYLVR